MSSTPWFAVSVCLRARPFALLVFLSCGAVNVSNAAPESSPSPSSGTTAQYVDRPATTTVSPSTYSHSYYPGALYPHYHHAWQGPTFSPLQTVPRILFPAPPPTFGDPLPRLRASSRDKDAVEAQLSSFVYEPFYAGLSGLITSEDLSRGRRRDLYTFRSLRAELLNELRARIAAVRDASPEVRRQEFVALSRDQAERLKTLEAQAEKLRDNIASGGLFRSSIDWDDARDWRLGDDLAFESREDEARVVRAAAYFQPGFSTAQRRLLRELAIELSEPVANPTATVALDESAPVIFFSPETSRFRLPYDLPAELTAEIDAYLEEKSALKRELLEAVYEKDRAWLERTRVRAFTELAENQAARIASLDTRAESIRLALAKLPNSATSGQLSDLPRALEDRIRAYLSRVQSVDQAYLVKLSQLRSAFPKDRVEFERTAHGAVIRLTPSRGTAKREEAKVASAEEELSGFNQRQLDAMRALTREKAEIRQAIATQIRQNHPLVKHAPVDVLLEEFAQVFEREINLDRYTEYRIALLEPGLSPEQRRLLFGGALEKFNLPAQR